MNPSENKVDPVAKTADIANKPLTIAEEMQQRMLRRQAAISGKQDQMEQRREREKASAKPVTVLTAKEMTTPAQPLPPPPPPPSDGSQQYSKLPTLAMSDDGSDDGPGRDDKSTDGDDFLAQIRNIKRKQDEGGATATAVPKQPPSLSKTEETKNPVANFESVRASHVIDVKTECSICVLNTDLCVVFYVANGWTTKSRRLAEFVRSFGLVR